MRLEEAYDEACRLLGAETVRSALLERALAQAEAERDEAGRRIVELTAESGDAPPSGPGCC